MSCPQGAWLQGAPCDMAELPRILSAASARENAREMAREHQELSTLTYLMVKTVQYVQYSTVQYKCTVEGAPGAQHHYHISHGKVAEIK